MPSVSKKQHNFMAAVAHNPAFAKKAGVPQSVGQDFSTADKGRKFAKGGLMAKSDMKEDMAADKKQDVSMIKKAFKQHDKQLHGGKNTSLKFSAGGYTRAADGVAQRGKTRGTMVKMCGGGMAKK